MSVNEDKRPWLQVQVPLWKQAEPYFEVPAKFARFLPGIKDPYRVVADDKSASAHLVAGSKDSLVAVYPDAISVSTPMGRERGGGWFAVGIAVLMVAMMLWLLVVFTSMFSKLNWGAAMPAFGMCMFSMLGWWMYRLLQHTPPERPILFCRRARQVHYFVPHPPPFWKFWKPVPVEIRSHNWDDTRVRCYKTHHGTGVTVREIFNIVLLWGGECGNPHLLKDFVQIGFQDDYDDTQIFQLWEHIRRYMEEGGSPILPGEALREPGNKNKPLEFPPEILKAAGGLPLSRQKVEDLASMISSPSELPA